ncbi:hypothetical protein JG687_00013076, partial [Phytophthora cactorum]
TPPRSLPRATSSAVATDTTRRPSSRSQQPSRTRSSRTRASQMNHLRSTLAMLEDREESRREELDRYPVDVGDNDTDVTSTCPILDDIYRDGGADAVLRLTNISPRELNVLWFSLRNHVVRYWNVGRGRRSTFAAKDVFFMLLVVMKCGGTWGMLARIFRIKTPTFIKTITGFIKVVAPKLHEAWVASQLDDVPMRVLQRSHQSARRKADGDHRLADNGSLATNYPEEWAVLADKGYQGLEDHVRCIHPKNGNQLTPEDRRQNELISSDRKFRGSEPLYDDIFQICVSLTNYHGTMHPLRDDNGLSRQYQGPLLAIGAEMKKRRRQSQDKYRRNQRLRHQMSLDDHPVHDDSVSDFSDAKSETRQMSF